MKTTILLVLCTAILLTGAFALSLDKDTSDKLIENGITRLAVAKIEHNNSVNILLRDGRNVLYKGSVQKYNCTFVRPDKKCKRDCKLNRVCTPIDYNKQIDKILANSIKAYADSLDKKTSLPNIIVWDKIFS